MKDTVENLIHLLQSEFDIHCELSSTAEEMNKAIKNGDIAALQRTSAQYDRQMAQLEALEEKRLLCCDSIAVQLNMPNRHTNVSRIIEQITDQSVKQKLCTLRDSLKAKIKELTEINHCNRILLEEGLHQIAKTFEMASSIQQNPIVYEKKGKKECHSIQRSLFNKIA